MERASQNANLCTTRLISIPLQTKYRRINDGADQSVGAMISEHLNFADPQNPTEHYEISWWDLWTDRHRDEEQDDRDSLELRLIDDEKKWCEEGTTTVSQRVLERGMAFNAVIEWPEQDPPPTITFLGYVPSTRLDVLLFGWWNKSGNVRYPQLPEERIIEFGYPYPVTATLNDVAFLDYGALGWTECLWNDEDGDRATRDPEKQKWYEEFWLNSTDGEWWFHYDEQGEEKDRLAEDDQIQLYPGRGFRYRSATSAIEDYSFFHDHMIAPVTTPYDNGLWW
jgi:hypothetical protein